MAGIVAIYGLVVAVLIADECKACLVTNDTQLTFGPVKPEGYTSTRGAIHLSAGMSVGFAGVVGRSVIT